MSRGRNAMLEHALAYAKRGWKVIPARPRGKAPATEHGFKDGTTAPTTIAEWWKRKPTANVAIVTGRASAIIVLDVDPRNGGDESLSALEQKHAPLPPTLTAATGGGGRHFFFRYPDGARVRTATIAPGLDLKADGGYVLATPSIHPSGGGYTWQNADELAPCPAWLFPAARVAPEGKAPPTAAPAPAPALRVPDAADSNVGKAFARLGMLGRLLADGKRTVICPWEGEHSAGRAHDTSTVIFPAVEVGGLGAFHCSHAHCSARTASTVLQEFERRGAADDARPAWQAGLRLTAKGELRSSFANVVLVLGSDGAYGNKLRLDEMRGVVEFEDREVSDAGVSAIRVDLEQRYGIQIGDAEAARAVHLVACRNGFHPVRDYLKGLHWDGVRRLNTVAADILHARAETDEETALMAVLVRRWFIGLVARALAPGCKVDTALILQGEQGVGKSTFFRAIAGDWFSDTEMALDKDAMMQLRGNWIYEWAELENVTGRHEMARIKAFLTSRDDKFRPPFGRAMTTVKRSGVIVGTTNKDEFLHDPSGSRRFWVISVGRIDIEQLRVVREQLLAEAVAAFTAHERWWLTEDEERSRSALVERFAEEDPWEEPVLSYAIGQIRVRIFDVLRDRLEFPTERCDKRAQMRVAAILRRHGYKPTQSRVDGQKGRYWCKPER